MLTSVHARPLRATADAFEAQRLAAAQSSSAPGKVALVEKEKAAGAASDSAVSKGGCC